MNQKRQAAAGYLAWIIREHMSQQHTDELTTQPWNPAYVDREANEPAALFANFAIKRMIRCDG